MRAVAVALLALAAADDGATHESYVFASLAARHLPTPARVSLGRDDATGLRGLFANEVAAPGDVLLRVPLGRCLVETRALPAAMRRAPESMTWDVRLALQLHDAVSDDSGAVPAFWSAYGALLPPAEAMVQPMLLRGAELAALGDGDMATSALAQRERLRDLFPGLPAEVLPPDDGAAAWPGSLLRAWALVRSRAYEAGDVAVTYDDGAEDRTDRFAFVPFLDMANHAAEPSATFVVAGDAIELRALHPLAVGEGATIAYADRDARQHFALYGHAPSAPADACAGAANPRRCAISQFAEAQRAAAAAGDL